MSFFDKIQAQWDDQKFVCVGLDPTYELLPTSLTVSDSSTRAEMKSITRFCTEIVDATHDVVCAYKPNSAFFENYGSKGIKVLMDVCDYIKSTYPSVPIIYDGKRGDIGNTNNGYTNFAFKILEADAITVSPYMGGESLDPFTAYPSKGIFVLCRTSNPGSGEFQQEQVVTESGKLRSLYQVVATNVRNVWNAESNCGLVAGATYPDELRIIRDIVGDDIPLLIPGIGAQGGDLEATIQAGVNLRGDGVIINSSRGIIYASQDVDFAGVARQKVVELNDQILAAIAM